MQETGNNPIHQEQNILSIRLSANGFSFFVSNPLQNRIVHQVDWELSADYSYLLNLIQAFRETEFLSSTYEKVNVLLVNERYNLIPLELFDEKQQDLLFDYNFSRTDNEIVFHNLLPNNSCAVSFGIDKDIYELLSSRYPAMLLYSQASVLTEHFSLLSRSVHHKQMFACLRKEYVDVCCFDRGFMSLVNSYKCSSVNDFSYYLLLIWKQLGMNQLNDELYIAGYTNNKDKLVSMLSQFVKKVTRLPAPEPVILPHNMSGHLPYDVRVLLSLKENI